MRKKLCMLIAFCYFGVLLLSCTVQQPNDDIEPIGMPARISFYTWENIRTVVNSEYDENWIAQLNEYATVDIRFFETKKQPLFQNMITQTEIIVPTSLVEVELLSADYTYDPERFSVDCSYDGLIYRLSCSPTADEMKDYSNEEYQIYVKKQKGQVPSTTAIISNISFQMYWNSEYRWYNGSFIHGAYTYDVSVMKQEDRASGTVSIAEDWDFSAFQFKTLQELFAN